MANKSKTVLIKADEPNEEFWAKFHVRSNGRCQLEDVGVGTKSIDPGVDCAYPEFKRSYTRDLSKNPITVPKLRELVKQDLKICARGYSVRVGDASPIAQEFIDDVVEPSHDRRNGDGKWDRNERKNVERLAMFCDKSEEYPDWSDVTLADIDADMLIEAEEWLEDEARWGVTKNCPQGREYSSKSIQAMTECICKVISKAIRKRSPKRANGRRELNVWQLDNPKLFVSDERPRKGKSRGKKHEVQAWEKRFLLDLIWDTNVTDTKQSPWSPSDKLLASLQIVCPPRTNQWLELKWADVKRVDVDGERIAIKLAHSKSGGEDRAVYVVIPHGRIEDEFRRHELRSRGKTHIFWETPGCPESGKPSGHWANRLSRLISKIPGTTWPRLSGDDERARYLKPANSLRASSQTEFDQINKDANFGMMSNEEYKRVRTMTADNTEGVFARHYDFGSDKDIERAGIIQDVMFDRIMAAKYPAKDQQSYLNGHQMTA